LPNEKLYAGRFKVQTAKQEQLAISLDGNEKFHREKMDEEDVNKWFTQV